MPRAGSAPRGAAELLPSCREALDNGVRGDFPPQPEAALGGDRRVHVAVQHQKLGAVLPPEAARECKQQEPVGRGVQGALHGGYDGPTAGLGLRTPAAMAPNTSASARTTRMPSSVMA